MFSAVKFREKISEKSGTTIILAVAVMFFVLLISAAAMTSALAFRNAGVQRRYNNIRREYAGQLAKYLTEQVTSADMEEIYNAAAPGTPQNPWYMIAQQVYNADPEGTGADEVKITNEKLTVSGAESEWFGAQNAAAVTMTVKKQRVTILSPYSPPAPSSDTPGSNGYTPEVEQINEQALVQAQMDIKITVKSHNKAYSLTASYEFYGLTLGDAKGTGVLVSGSWRLLGYYQ